MVMKQIYLFNIVAWSYRKKIGFPVCKKENFAGLQAYRRRGKSARASPTPRQTLNEDSPLNLYPPCPDWLVCVIGVRISPFERLLRMEAMMLLRSRLWQTVHPLSVIRRFSNRTETKSATGKRVERTKHDFQCPICRFSIGQTFCLICARRCQLTFPFLFFQECSVVSSKMLNKAVSMVYLLNQLWES